MVRGRFRSLVLLCAFFVSVAVWNAAPVYSTRAAPAVQAPAPAPALPPGVERVTSVEGITEYRLANGLRVLLFPDPTKPTITVNVTYLVGSAHEAYGETGMAHLLEHMLFKGSTNHKNIPQELTEHGARPNGNTWFDRTNYFETFQFTDENLRWALDLESDRMVNSFVAKKDLDSEMTVVRNEFEMGENDPGSVLEERVMSTAFLWHNYGHSTIGARSDIEGVPIERLQAFYKRYYQPDNAVLLVAGKFDEPKTLALVQQYFGKIPVPTRKLEKPYTKEPTQDGERGVTLRRVGDVQFVMAAYHLPAGSHPDFPAIDVLMLVLADSPSGRLYKALVETKKAATVFGWAYQLKDPGEAIFAAQVRKEDSLDAARDELLKTLDGVAANPPSKEEVDRARQQLLKDIELNLNSSERVGLQLGEWASMGDWRLLFLHRDRLRKVTPADVQRVAAAYLKSSNRTVGLFIPTAKPERAEIPAAPDIAAELKGYKGEAPIALGEAFDSSPANIESRTRRFELPNGMKVALLSKKTRGGTLVASMHFRFGDEKSLSGRAFDAAFAGAMLMRGTAKHTREQIKDEFDRLKARVNVSGGATNASASIETTRENLPEVMKLLAEVLRQPAFPDKEFEELRQADLAETEQAKSDPEAIADNAFSRHLGPYRKEDVRYTPTIDEKIELLKAATVAASKKFYTDFYGASNAQLSIVGDFDDKQMSALLTELFGPWKSPRPFTRVPSLYQDVPVLSKSFETPDKANAILLAGLNLQMRDDDPDFPAMVLGNYMLGGGFLNSRLATRIRQKEGLSYGVGSSFHASPLDKSGTFVTYAIYAPQNAAKLEAALKEEIERALKDGFTANEVKAAKSGWLQSRQVSRSQDPELAGRLSEYLYIDRTLARDAELDKKVEALTPEQILAAMRRHIDLAKLSVFKAGDFAKK
ncbi:MAG: pitrilysin family protein [Acidobacteria bacterium]|nr:pitrilysin family protein [Acidobacteriota bacterium]